MVGKKLVFYGMGDIRVEEMESIPVPGPGELLIKVDAASICGSDIKSYRVGNPKMCPPRTIGHEFSGTVMTPVMAEGFAEGDRVTMATTIGCGSCYYCKMGKPNLCKDAKAMGFFFDGALASYMIIPAEAVKRGNVVKVSGDAPPEVIALAEPMSCVLNGLCRIPVRDITSALIIGVGAMGMLHAIALREFGVKNIVCCSSPGRKKELMDSLGFFTLTPDELEERYLELSDGLGFELVIIAAPSNAVQSDAPKYARKGGYISYFAGLPVAEERIAVSSRTLHYNELIFYGTSDSSVEHVRDAIELLDTQRESVSKLITVLPIDEALDGMRSVMDKKAAKIVVFPNGANGAPRRE
jgi:L-iditol 2-dehydrogenase